MSTDYDVLIVGGGLVGASLACALGESGLAIGMVEAVPLSSSAQPSYDDRTLALAHGSRRIFEGIGVWSSIRARGASPIRRIHISDRGRFGIARLEAADAGLDALGYVVASRDVGASLYEQIESHAGTVLRCPARVQAVAFEQDAARVTIEGGGAIETVTARLVVAADGAHSPVREMAGIAASRIDYGQSAVVANVTPGRAHRDTAYERFTETGPLALLPYGPERCAVVWNVPSAQVNAMLAWDDDTFRAELQERFGDRLGRFGQVGKRQAYSLALTRVREHVRERLALIGNAAHTVHPVAGQGFNLGLRDVAALAEILDGARRTGADLGDRAVLDRYADWRRRDNQVTSAFTHSLIRLFSNDYLPVAAARNAALIAIDLFPSLKRRFIRRTSGMSGGLPRLALGLPLSGPPSE